MNSIGFFTPSPFSDNLERLHALSHLSKNEWLDLLGLSWKKYYQYKVGLADFPTSSLNEISKYFSIAEDALVQGELNFSELEARLSSKDELPEKYTIGAYGRRRTPITSIEYLEKAFGWRLKYDVLNHFQMSAATLQDPFATISIQMITDMAEYLKKRQFKANDFFRMGVYSAEGNRYGLIGKIYSEMENLEQVYTIFLNKMIFMFEKNCTYNYEQVTKTSGLLVMKSCPDIASELKVKYLGSESICELKAGLLASLPSYMGLNNAKIIHFTCEHRGDDACRFHVDQMNCSPLSSD